MGKIGEIVEVDPDGDFLVAIDDDRACFAPSMVEHADGSSIAVGCQVRVRQVSPEEAKALQQSHGGWSDGMGALLGREGLVLSIDGDGDVHVSFDGHTTCLNPRLIELVSTLTTFPVGSLVRIKRPALEEVRGLQQAHGGWDERMADQLGRVGRYDGEGGVGVDGVDETFQWNPALLENANMVGSFTVGLPVRIRDVAVEEARRLQGGVAGFPDRMQQTLGKVGELTGIRPNNALRVTVKGSCDTFHPTLVELAPAGYEADRRCGRGHKLTPAPGRGDTPCVKCAASVDTRPPAPSLTYYCALCDQSVCSACVPRDMRDKLLAASNQRKLEMEGLGEESVVRVRKVVADEGRGWRWRYCR